MKSRVTLLTAVVAVLVLGVRWQRGTVSGADQLPPLHSRVEMWTGQGLREYVIHIPNSCDRSRPAAVVLMLHGFGGTAINAAKETGCV